MASKKRKHEAPHQDLGHIEKIILENFKSYEGVHEIGPFDKFTCIIGPNGSGKSNVMDGISFCLGIRAKHLRGDRLKDLVYRREEEDVDSNTRKASVTIVFRTGGGEILHFSRRIDVKGTGSYRYGPPGKLRSCVYDEFLEALAGQSIFVKARNFLVFQGDVMELARRQGTDLTGVLETISGSDQLKEKYEKLSKDVELAQEKARMHFQHRREIEGAVQLLAKQRAEVERYHELRAKKTALLIETVLFKLYCAGSDLKRKAEAGEAVRSELSAGTSELAGKRREAEETDKERKKIETQADKAASEHYVLSSNLEQLKPESNNCKKQATHWAKKLKEKDDQIRNEETKHSSWDASIAQTKEDRKKAEGEILKLQAKQLQSALQLTDEQRVEYERAVAKTDALNSRTREQLREADEQLCALADQVDLDKRDVRDLEERRSAGRAKFEELAQEKAGIALELDNEATLLEQHAKQVKSIQDDVKKFTSFRDSLVEEQRSLRFKLDSAKARRERLAQVEGRQRVADELRAAFPNGIVGRISELVLPTQKRFDMPLQTALGGMAEAFVVTDSATGRECVRYLKSKRIATETFLPLDRATPANAGPLHLLTQGQQARRLATMCVQHNEKFLERHHQWQKDGPAFVDRAVAFLLGQTIIVDDLEEAKKTSYQDAKKKGLMPRVVTLDGEVIQPNGNMSVQSIGSLGRVEFGGAEQLQEMKAQEQKLMQVDQDLSSLREELSRKHLKEAEIAEQQRMLQDRHTAGETRFRALEAAQATEQQFIQSRTTRIDELKAKVEQGAKKQKELEGKKDGLEVELLKVGKKFFTSLNKELGVEDVREVVRREQKEKLANRKEIEELEDFVRGLVAEERNLERMRASAKLDGLRRDAEQYKRDIDAANKRVEELEQKEAQFAERCEESRLKLQQLNLKKEDLEKLVKDKRAIVATIKQSCDEKRKILRQHNQKVRMVLSITCEILRECHERQIEVPFKKKDDTALETILSREKDLDDIPFEDLDRACRTLEVDFQLLPEAKKEQAQQTRVYDARGVESEYDAQIAEISREIEGLSPNMKAPEELASEEKRLREIRDQADAANLESHRLSRDFEAVKSERVQKFMKCFKHVEAAVNPFYQALTKYEGFQGGSAYLDLEDAEEPYNGGIMFTACPPGKRFFPMELLSGGEKSMASMALLFAMHSFQPPPFMILDEVDAPFDRKNTNSLVNYLKKLHFQCLVISLKDTFFSHSDSIVGIFKDKQAQTSGTLSLALQRLGEESEAYQSSEVPLADALNEVN